VPIFQGLESGAFRERFGPVDARFPTPSLPIAGTPPLGALLDEARRSAEPSACPVVFRDGAGGQQRFVAEAFFNQYCFFLTFAPHSRLRSGRRIAVRAS
jgi:hypothetical protein